MCFLLSIVLLLIESVKPNKGEKAHAKFESEKPYQSDLSIQQEQRKKLVEGTEKT